MGATCYWHLTKRQTKKDFGKILERFWVNLNIVSIGGKNPNGFLLVPFIIDAQITWTFLVIIVLLILLSSPMELFQIRHLGYNQNMTKDHMYYGF